MPSIPARHELTVDQIAEADAETLRTAYRELLAHHISETTELWRRLNLARTKLDEKP